MSSLRCRIGWHDWDKYGKLVKAYSGLTQFRVCKRCNKMTYASCYGNQADPEIANETTNQSLKNNQGVVE